jgi:hypothetical protein
MANVFGSANSDADFVGYLLNALMMRLLTILSWRRKN